MSQTPEIFDTALIEHFRQRAAKRAMPGVDFLLARTVDDLAERLATVDRRFTHGLDLHSHTDSAARALQHSGKVTAIERIETAPAFITADFPARIAPREQPALPLQGADLIVSLLSLHLVNDLPGLLTQIRLGLKPDGLFLAALCGAGTLGELRESLLQAESELDGGASPRIIPFADIRDVGSLLQRTGFALPVTDIENTVVRYDNAFTLMADLRAMGMQNALHNRSRKPVSKRFFSRVAEIYAERFSDPDGRIRATFSILWLSGWAPHKDQQKPAKRGSAQMPLAEALEHFAGK
ncbi:MAG: Methyltransferase type 11 [Candidatus Tokpelaia hoelldobleri]|uniref:Methyltransferase type 11 n=1 Tax=Candidatus Tokpelaia hoelldobleri TaxID=1902579 RepID=A0A1U9JWD6_9HYPH|nr:MAG: Methyltransferase type 11 [Candidatus Tokpelaia hoelldoblerii]